MDRGLSDSAAWLPGPASVHMIQQQVAILYGEALRRREFLKAANV